MADNFFPLTTGLRGRSVPKIRPNTGPDKGLDADAVTFGLEVRIATEDPTVTDAERAQLCSQIGAMRAARRAGGRYCPDNDD